MSYKEIIEATKKEKTQVDEKQKEVNEIRAISNSMVKRLDGMVHRPTLRTIYIAVEDLAEELWKAGEPFTPDEIASYLYIKLEEELEQYAKKTPYSPFLQ